jgi:hypothetical protein
MSNKHCKKLFAVAAYLFGVLTLTVAETVLSLVMSAVDEGLESKHLTVSVNADGTKAAVLKLVQDPVPTEPVAISSHTVYQYSSPY